MDAPLTLACALGVEERAARKGGAPRTVRVGLGAALGVPDGRLASFGLAGALVTGLPPGTVITATRVVDEDGALLWQGESLAVDGARPAVVCGARRIVDDPAERALLAERTGASAVDMESAVLARSGRLAGVVRAVSDAPDRPVGKLGNASRPDGGVAWGAVAGAFLTEPGRALRAVRDARRAIASLERAAASLCEATR